MSPSRGVLGTAFVAGVCAARKFAAANKMAAKMMLVFTAGLLFVSNRTFFQFRGKRNRRAFCEAARFLTVRLNRSTKMRLRRVSGLR
jgi:hypothetical protein